MKQKKQSKNYTAPALDKGLDILELLSENKEGLTQAEIAHRLNKSVNEIYRMISTLRNREYVDFDEDGLCELCGEIFSCEENILLKHIEDHR